MSAETIQQYYPEEPEQYRPQLSLVVNQDPTIVRMHLLLADAVGQVVSYADRDVDSSGRPRFFTAAAWANRQAR